MGDERHIREERILALKAEYDAIRKRYIEQCEHWGVDMLPCLECDDPDSSAVVKEILWRPYHKLNYCVLPECCCRRREYFAKKKATAAMLHPLFRSGGSGP
jgi:hypothetical protein